jgi:hypothetical protein
MLVDMHPVGWMHVNELKQVKTVRVLSPGHKGKQ